MPCRRSSPPSSGPRLFGTCIWRSSAVCSASRSPGCAGGVRGGAEALTPPALPGLAGRPFSVNQTINADAKQAIAREAVTLCADGEPIIINGGTTTFQMVHPLANRRVQVLTNSFPIANQNI